MNNDTDDVLDGIDDLAPARHPFLDMGDYVLELKGINQGKAFKSKKKFFSATVEVVSSTSSTLKPGSLATIRIEENEYPQYMLRDVRNLMAAVFNKQPEQVTKQDIKELRDGALIAAAKPKFQARRAFFETKKGGASMWTQYVALDATLPPSVQPPPQAADTKTTQKRK